MVTLPKLTQYLEELLQVSTIADYCPNGLQVQGRHEIKKIATSVSASLEAIKGALEQHADALIVHHGIFWNKDSYVIKGAKLSKIKALLDNEMSLFGYHLPLDMHKELGNNWKAARDMGWRDLQPFCFQGNMAIGVKGIIDPMPREAFAKKLQDYYRHPVNAVWAGEQLITSVGLVSGGAHRNISDAVADGLSCYITGSFDEPIWNIAHEERINFIAMGHAATEWIGPKALGEHLAKEFNLQHVFIDIPNPF